jgi:hypothetical protein
MSVAIRFKGFLTRFNRWFEGAAVAASASPPDQSASADAIHVKTVLGEVEKETLEEQPPEEQEQPPPEQPP